MQPIKVVLFIQKGNNNFPNSNAIFATKEIELPLSPSIGMTIILKGGHELTVESIEYSLETKTTILFLDHGNHDDILDEIVKTDQGWKIGC